ncbi:MAG: hypothetical protein LBQ54_07190 [Planctomycetaceae bacterium]|jgi:SSS family solute:Na+ symporter|nr:hypothetical protein [Planctomycetaceae bacterium]
MLLSLSFWLTLIFFLFILGITFWGMKRTSDINDFFLGGKTLGPWILAISYGTAYFSAAAFIGFAGKLGWQYGLNVLWISLGNTVLGGCLAWLVLGKRTRSMSRNLNVMTMPEFFAERYDSQKMKAVSAVIIFVFMIPYSASVYQGLTYLFESTFRISFEAALLIIMVMTGIYIIAGGYQAVARIDFFLGIVMFTGAILMVFFLVSHFGGWTNVVEQVNNLHRERSALPAGEPLAIPKAPWFILPSLVFMTSFGVWGMPQMVHKYYAIKEERQIVRGAIVTTVFAAFVVGAAYFVGSMCQLTAPEFLPLDGNELVFDRLVPDFLSLYLPPVLMAVILLLVLSASMTTLASLVLVSASAVSIDLYKGYFNPKASSGQMLFLMRCLSGFFILASFVVAVGKISWIVTLMSVSWGAIAGSFMAPFLYGLFWKRAAKAGAYAGMFTGLILSNGLFFTWLAVYGKEAASALSPVFASAAMIVPFATLPIVSFFSKPPSAEIVNKAFRRRSEEEDV